ncbi:MAG: hypothetical protein AAF503_03090 [Pseudomonadota bacterium]
MNNLLTTLEGLSGLWATWAAIALLAGLGIWALMNRIMCPLAKGACNASVEDARAALSKRIFAGPRFLLTMLLAITATIVGLKLIYVGSQPGVAVFLIIAGLVVMQTEPIRLSIKEAQNRVVASSVEGVDSQAAAVEYLRGRHHWLVGVHFIILAGVVAAVMAF